MPTIFAVDVSLSMLQSVKVRQFILHFPASPRAHPTTINNLSMLLNLKGKTRPLSLNSWPRDWRWNGWKLVEEQRPDFGAGAEGCSKHRGSLGKEISVCVRFVKLVVHVSKSIVFWSGSNPLPFWLTPRIITSSPSSREISPAWKKDVSSWTVTVLAIS